jgi:hypothetical protein
VTQQGVNVTEGPACQLLLQPSCTIQLLLLLLRSYTLTSLQLTAAVRQVPRQL